VINAITSLTLAIFAPIWGSIADSHGRKPMLMRAMIGGSVLLGLMAFVTSPWQLLVLKSLQGCVTGTVAAATVLTATMVPEEEIGYRLGLLQMAVFLGSSMGPLIGGIVGDIAGNRMNFVITGALLAISAVLVARWVKEDWKRPIPAGLPAGGRTGAPAILKRMVPDLSVIASNPVLVGLLASVFAVQLAGAIANPILPLVILDLSGGAAGTSTMAGIIIGASSLSGALAAALIGGFSARFGYSRTLFVCLFMSFVFYIPQGLVHTPQALLVLRIASGAALGGTMPSVNALIARAATRGKQGAVFGLSTSVAGTGAALGPVFGALIANTAGYFGVFFATGIILGLTALSVRLGRSWLRKQRLEREEAEIPVPIFIDASPPSG
jgi:DHA1 family multidrug resistance protein-like MFS transporter